jgi:quinol monooxygenase YgiN
MDQSMSQEWKERTLTVSHGFHATMTARPGKGDDVVQLLLNAPSLAHDDCVVFLVGRSTAHPDTVYVTEGWTSEQAHRTFFATEPAQALVAALEPLLTGESRYTDEMPVGGKATF